MQMLSYEYKEILEAIIKHFETLKDTRRAETVINRIKIASELGKLKNEFVISLFTELSNPRDRILILQRCSTNEAKSLLNKRF